MPTSSTRPISVAEAFEMVPSEDSWINDGLSAVVRSIAQPKPGAQKKFWKCVLADTVGSATINMTLFSAPRFSEGDQIEITGKGIKRKEYNGTAEISIGKTSEIHVVGRSVHHEEQSARAAAGAPAVNGQLQHVAGPTVGMSIKHAMDLLTADLPPHAELRARLETQAFWSDVHRLASDIIRISHLLEVGKLAPSIKDRLSPKPANAAPAAERPAQAAPASARRSSPPTERELANLDSREGRDVPTEDVPF